MGLKGTVTALLAAAFALFLFASQASDLHRATRELEGRIDASDAQVRALQKENSHLQSALEAGLDGVDKKIDGQIEKTRPDAEALYEDILRPSVQVDGKGGVGGGTILFSRGEHTYVITAYHVVHKSILRKEGREERDPVQVRLYDGRGMAQETARGEFVAYDERKDLALLKIPTPKRAIRPARLADRRTLRAVRVFTPVYAVGCPLGHDPLPTPGEIVSLNKDVGGEKFWMMSAPTIFGNSGGGIFHRETRELIGVSVMICTYDGVVSTPVPHLGILLSLEAVYDWLDALDYQFVYDPAFPPGRPRGAVRTRADR